MEHEYSLSNPKDWMLRTVNKMGITTVELAPPTQAFVEFAAHCKQPVLDVGCGFGFSSLAALKNGAKVIAFDLAKQHLQTLTENTPSHLQANLKTICGHLPEDLNIQENSLSAVHACMILHFLTGEDIRKSLKRFYASLEPGGHLFLGNMSPYLAIYDTDALLKEYNEREARSEKWPGYIQHLPYVKKEWKNQLPTYAHFIKVESAVNFVAEAGFEVQNAYYYTLQTLPEVYKNHNKEYVGVHAIKL